MEYHDKSRENEEKGNKIISFKSLFGHFRLRKFQEGFGKGTPLTWTVEAALHKFIHPTRKLCFGCFECKAPSTLIRSRTKTEHFCSGRGYRPHYNAENDHRKRNHSKTLSGVERFENDAFFKTLFSGVDGENDAT